MGKHFEHIHPRNKFDNDKYAFGREKTYKTPHPRSVILRQVDEKEDSGI